MESQNNVVKVIDEALEAYAKETIVPKTRLVDVFLDIRLSTSEPAVREAVDEALRTFTAPTLVEGDHARAALNRVRQVAAEPRTPALV